MDLSLTLLLNLSFTLPTLCYYYYFYCLVFFPPGVKTEVSIKMKLLVVILATKL